MILKLKITPLARHTLAEELVERVNRQVQSWPTGEFQGLVGALEGGFLDSRWRPTSETEASDPTRDAAKILEGCRDNNGR